VAGGGVPAGCDGLAGELKWDGALDGAGLPVASLAAPKTCLLSSIATSMV